MRGNRWKRIPRFFHLKVPLASNLLLLITIIPVSRKTMKIKWFSAVVLLAVAISVALSLRPSSRYTTSSTQAYNYFTAGMDAAERLYNTEALENFEAAVQLDSGFASAWAYLSKYYDINGRTEEAKLAAKRAFKLAQDLPERERLNIELLTADLRGDKDKFEEILERMLERYPDEIEPHIYKGNRLWRRGDLEGAIAEYQTVLKLNPNHAPTYNNLGYLYAQMGDFDQAIAYLKKYIFIAPDQANPHDSLGEIYMMIGRYQDALDHFRRALAVKPALDTEPNNLGCTIQLHIAQTLIRKGKLKEAQQHITKARELSIGKWYDQRARFQEGMIHLAREDYAQAEQALNEIRLEKGKCNLDVEVSLARVYYEQDQPGKIRMLLDQNEDLFGELLVKMGEKPTAMTDSLMRYYARKSPSCENIYLIRLFLQLYAQLAMGDFAAAYESSDRIINGDFPYFYRLYGQYLRAETAFVEGRYRKTIEELSPLMEINPNYARVILMQAKAQQAYGDIAAAKETLETFLATFSDADLDWAPRREAEAVLEQINAAEPAPS